MIAAAFDLGDHLGWAVKNKSGAIYSGAEDLKGKATQSAGIRFLAFEKLLRSMFMPSQFGTMPKTIFFEEVRRHNGTQAAHVYGGYKATLISFCEFYGIDYLGIPVGTIKKYWTGNGAAKKDEMILEAVRRGFSIKTDDQADALAILHCGLKI